MGGGGKITGGTPTPSGLLFGPNSSGKEYLSSYAHRRNNPADPRKSHWSSGVPPPTEYGIFCTADSRDWSDEDGNYWGVHSAGRTPLGVRGERLCKFPKTSNPNDPWHGFPVSPQNGGGDVPPDALVESWITAEVVSRVIGRRIQKRKI